ncbi:uncharacterized protein LOC110980836 isoform X2 [Acanthaster planci]|uniref:Uncharacterized protein LOC110980836 isoform X2 n=1 Tax=Acanthaster planci TaxID=133434 RepID=A0A8B7YQ34_ACAPL|nr:uncharacterized protein LOC110980836 isoform X2 [Acanthaster planci]
MSAGGSEFRTLWRGEKLSYRQLYQQQFERTTFGAMANGSYRLDLKRDDARTLMLKMDARLTYAGRERNAAYQLEGERELRHIDYARQLINADFNRAKRDIERRLEYFQTLQEHNRERRKKREIAWCEEEEKDWERQARAARRRRTLPKIKIHKNHKAEVVGSIRRDQKREFANKISHEMHLNRSLNALSDSYAKHKALSEQNVAILEKVGEAYSPAGQKSESGQHLPSIKPMESQGEPKLSKTKYGMPTQTINLPEVPVSKAGPQKSSLSQMISSGEVCKLPGIVLNENQPIGTSGAPQKLSLARTFYMNTSSNLRGASTNQDLPAAFTRSRRRVSIVDPSADASNGPAGARSRRRFSLVDPSIQSKKRLAPKLTLGPHQQVPLRFYEIEDNPFLKEGDNPEITRSNDLIRSDKADEMYVWLGFDSEEEYEKLKRGELVLEFDDDGSDTSSNADHHLTSERLRELQEMAEVRPTGTPEDLPKRTESKLSAPRILIASAGGMDGMKPLEKFASAAKMVMVVRQFQTSAIK